MHEVYPNNKQLCLRESFCNVYLNDMNLIGSDGVSDDHLLSYLFSPDLPVWLNSSHSASDDAEVFNAQLFRTTLLRITHCHGCHASFGLKKTNKQATTNQLIAACQPTEYIIFYIIVLLTMIKLIQIFLKCGGKQLITMM